MPDANVSDPEIRYELRKLNTGWCVWDIRENAPATAGGGWHIDLTPEDARDLMEQLNRRESGKSAS